MRLAFNNILSQLPAEYRIQARRRLAQNSRNPVDLNRIAALGWHLFQEAEPESVRNLQRQNEENINAVPDQKPKGFGEW